MVGDPFKKVHAGDPLEISAEAWNALSELAQQAKMGAFQRTETPRVFARLPCVTALVRNNTGANRNPFEIVALRGELEGTNPFENQKNPMLWAEIPQEGDICRPVAVYLEPCEAGQLGIAVLAGLTLAKIESPHWRKPLDIKPGDCTKLQCVEQRTGVGWLVSASPVVDDFYAIWLQPQSVAVVMGYLVRSEIECSMKLGLADEDPAFPAAPLAGPFFWGIPNQLQSQLPPTGAKMPFYRFVADETWYFFCPPEWKGIDQTVQIDTPNTTHWLTFEKGHLVGYQPGLTGQPGQIEVGGGIIPGDALGKFFIVPGLWNGMPQWQNAQHPNWWIRWVPLPNNPQQGRWVIGQWPLDAQQGQQPQRGWGHRPPAEGEPPQQNPIDEFLEQIGDVGGVPQVITVDYLIQDCTDLNSFVELVNSGQFRWPVDQVIKWADAQGRVHCGRVADLPVQGIKVQQWQLIGLEKNCQACGTDVVVADCNLPEKKYRLQGSGSLGLQPGQVIVWVANPGGSLWEEFHCGTVQDRSDICTHDASPGAWAFGKVVPSCQQCPSGACPSQPSCPSYPGNPPCPESCPCIEVIGRIQPADALGVYTLQGTWNEHCWWRKGDWAIYYVPSTTKWFIQNLQNTAQYWQRHGDVFGAYLPRDTGETQGVAIVIGR